MGSVKVCHDRKILAILGPRGIGDDRCRMRTNHIQKDKDILFKVRHIHLWVKL